MLRCTVSKTSKPYKLVLICTTCFVPIYGHRKVQYVKYLAQEDFKHNN